MQSLTSIQALTNSKSRKELAQILNRSAGTIRTEALRILKMQGLIEREDVDGRLKIWKITDKGLELLKDEKALEKLRSRQFTLL